MKKDFKFTIRNNEGKIIVQEIVTFGNESNPFHSDWKNDTMLLSELFRYKDEFLYKHMSVDFDDIKNGSI